MAEIPEDKSGVGKEWVAPRTVNTSLTQESVSNIEQESDDIARQNAKKLFDAVCIKYKGLAELNLDFERFFSSASLSLNVEIEDESDINSQFNLLARKSKLYRLTDRIVGIISGNYSNSEFYTYNDIKIIKNLYKSAQEVGIDASLPDVIFKVSEDITIDDPNVNKSIVEILCQAHKIEEAKRQQDGNKLCDELGCQYDPGILSNFREIKWLRDTIATVITESKILCDIEQELLEHENYSTLTEAMSDTEIEVQIAIRERLLNTLGLNWDSKKNTSDFGLNLQISARISGNKNMNRSVSIPALVFNEQEVVYGGIILAPQGSTQSLLESVKLAMKDLGKTLPDYEEDYAQFSLQNEIFSQIWNNFLNSGFKGKKVFEIGGESASSIFEQFGAEAIMYADSGYSEYGMTSYHPGSKEKMIEISNYQQYSLPHSVDLVCTSRLFDTGSGVGEIAQISKDQNNADQLGERELLLVIANILKDKGFMINFYNPLNRSFEGLGFAKLSSVSSGASIYRFHENEITVPESFSLGRKSITFKPTRITFEILDYK